MKIKTNSKIHAHGMSLIEILVAMIIFSVGALAIAGLQVRSLKSNQSVDSRASATSLLSDIADRIRANPQGAINGDYSLTTSYTQQRTEITSGSVALPLPNNCSTAAANCTPSQIAANDIEEWRLALNRGLPEGAGAINGAADTGYTVTIAWFDKDLRGATGNLDQSATCAAPAATFSSANAMNSASMQQRTCCPATVGSPVAAGVRCLNLLVKP
jgi:type IV pilus assembly protein PilV